MLGRGILNIPNLANTIRFNHSPLNWHQVMQLLLRYAMTSIEDVKPLYHSARIKQWLAYLRQYYPQASILLPEIRQLKSQNDICEFLNNHLAN